MDEMTRRRLAAIAVCCTIPLAAACGSSIKQAGHTAQAVPSVPSVAPIPIVRTEPVPDPVVTLIAESDRHFKIGESELESGHAAAAKLEFDRAVDVLLESSYGARSEPRIRAHFDRLVDRISSYEVKALAEGDGFSEKRYEPATIDELLAASATLTTTPAPSTTTAVDADLRSGGYDLPIPFNERVLSFVQLFQGRMHDFLEEGLRRGAKYLPMIQNVFRAEGLPLDLAYVPLVESAFKPNALSRARAKGVWQFMSGTGAENGLRQDWYIDERSDPEKATVAAAKYLSTLGRLFEGDWHLALASYNGGPGRMQRAIQAAHSNDFWKLSAGPRFLPRETRDYVPMILAAIIIARNPTQYGFEVEAEAVQAYETVDLRRPVDLRRVAEWTSTTIDEIQDLNPELRRWTTPVRDEPYSLRVPTGTADVVRSRIETPAEDLASLNWYVVKKGDTLSMVAKKLRVSQSDLADANYLTPATHLNVGQKLMVPREVSAAASSAADRSVRVANSRAVDTVQAAVDTGNVAKVSHLVKSGDTLSSIAVEYGTSVESILTWNQMNSVDIRAGDRLIVYTVRAN